MFRPARLLLLAFLILLPVAALAQDAGVIDTVVTRFQTVTNGWEGRLQGLAMGTFGLLASIGLFWAIAKHALRRSDLSELLAELVNQISFIGLFFWLMTTMTTWAPLIIKSFRYAAGVASGTTVLTPGDVFRVGIDVAGKIIGKWTILDPTATAGLVIAGLVVLGCFAFICTMMVCALVDSYFIAAAGVLFMAFGGSMWTKDIAIGVIRQVLGVGAKLFALQLVVSVGATFIQQWDAQFANVTIQGALIEIGQSLVLAGVTAMVPKMFERIAGGMGIGSGGAILGAAATLAAATVALSRAATSLATSVAGAGALTGSSAALASTQMAARVAAGKAPATSAGRAAAMLGATARNVASGVGTDIGRRLSGQGTRFGVASFRQAADLAERSRLLNEQNNAPPPPKKP
jgi:P-type conjugative transfer protein TrbL